MPEFVLDTTTIGAGEGLSRLAFDGLDSFTRGYIEAMFFTETDTGGTRESFDPENGSQLPGDVGADDLHPTALENIAAGCKAFQEKNAALLDAAYAAEDSDGYAIYNDSQAGRDFWFSRNGHGVGFWDRGLGDVGDKLHEATKAWGEAHVWFGDHVDFGDAPFVHVDKDRLRSPS